MLDRSGWVWIAKCTVLTLVVILIVANVLAFVGLKGKAAAVLGLCGSIVIAGAISSRYLRR